MSRWTCGRFLGNGKNTARSGSAARTYPQPACPRNRELCRPSPRSRMEAARPTRCEPAVPPIPMSKRPHHRHRHPRHRHPALPAGGGHPEIHDRVDSGGDHFRDPARRRGGLLRGGWTAALFHAARSLPRPATSAARLRTGGACRSGASFGLGNRQAGYSSADFMMLRVLESAKEDLIEGFHFYEEQAAGLEGAPTVRKQASLGNALGSSTNTRPSPERAAHVVAPFQGWGL